MLAQTLDAIRQLEDSVGAQILNLLAKETAFTLDWMNRNA